MSDFQRNSSMENYKRESALKVARRNATKTPSSLSEVFRHTNWVLGTDCTGAIKVAMSHQQGAALYEKRRICEAEKSTENAKPIPMAQIL